MFSHCSHRNQLIVDDKRKTNERENLAITINTHTARLNYTLNCWLPPNNTGSDVIDEEGGGGGVATAPSLGTWLVGSVKVLLEEGKRADLVLGSGRAQHLGRRERAGCATQLVQSGRELVQLGIWPGGGNVLGLQVCLAYWAYFGLVSPISKARVPSYKTVRL